MVNYLFISFAVLINKLLMWALVGKANITS